ncbi:MAG: tRNA (adenosine(37)-N6)-threonylcarbamoyltransferase complex dimerization subunit type 1 TsaB [Melioribacteraceae bacterium]|nr:tRNA (adenosine(37)-N6)-threonylcarbamoyltransferase complex dimerization subunit type 1 TsaB [Melioribacteraceae bacterium]
MNNRTPILALETSGELCSAAVLLNENNYSEVTIKQKHVHSRKLFAVIDQSLQNCSVNKRDIKSIAVSIGPGSFTGLRIGLSGAKGIAAGLNIPIIPVPTFDVCAYEIFEYNPHIKKLAIVGKVNTTELYFKEFSIINQTNLNGFDLMLINQSELMLHGGELTLFGNYDHDSVNKTESPRASSVAKWAYIFGEDLLTFNFDYLEPDYVKKFVVKAKK